jgi:alpha-1,2-mannosyltransferase
MSASTPAVEGQRPRASYEALVRIAFIGLPAVLTLYVFYIMVKLHAVSPDFNQEFWVASHRLVVGLNPYDRGWMHIGKGVAYPYPALTALVFAPFAILPHQLAAWLFTAANIGAVFLTQRLLGVRDARVYGVALVWPVVIDAWQTGNLTLVLALGIAWLWRSRDHPWIAGALVACMISLKPFIWPLALWLLVTRRYAALAYAVVVGVCVNVVAWAVVGFNQLHAYNSVVNAVTDAMWRRGYEPASVALHLGASHSLAYAIGVVIAVAIGVACAYAGLRGDSQRALTLCIALALVATPVLWTHYFALLIVPMALARPRLGWVWFVPLVMWVCPVNPMPWQAFVALGVSALIVVTCLRRPRQGAESAEPPSGGGDQPRAIALLRAEPRPS